MTASATASNNPSRANADVQSLVYESCLLLNEENWQGFLDLCDPGDFRYSITNFAPEIRRNQIWMDRGWDELKHLMALLPRHNSDHSILTRHATVYRVKNADRPEIFDVVSVLTLYRTQLDGVNSAIESGMTALYAVGQYLDTVRRDRRGLKFMSRTVRLDTRQMDIGSHYLF